MSPKPSQRPVKPKSKLRGNFVDHVPKRLRAIQDPSKEIPQIAKDERLMRQIHEATRSISTTHNLRLGDARVLNGVEKGSVHLVLTSPPYWSLKQYNASAGQLGNIVDYESFMKELGLVWQRCFDSLIPGGRLICVVGDVCLSRRQNNGRHTVVPLHSSIQEQCRLIGYDNLAPIIWHKIANAKYEVDGGSRFLGKPYEPNSVIKNDIEYILMLRKPGGYRNPDLSERILSVVSAENYQKWFQQIWTGLGGASTKDHPAPYPLGLAERLIRMFSFVGDTILDPFMGTGTTSLAAAMWGRNSIGFEIDEEYLQFATSRIENATHDVFGQTTVKTVLA